ncbi:MAG TPA: hypothetical protein VGI81_20215 [Tepidisphaeraceae bacterium]|jgi:hypothetical protein
MILVLLVCLLIVLAVLAGIWINVAADRPWRPKVVDEPVRGGPVCGGCGYSVVGLSRMTCPECGGDLRTVGILTPLAPRSGIGVLGACIGFSVLLAFIAIVASIGIYSVLPPHRSFEKQVWLMGPKSGAYALATLEAKGATWRTPPLNVPVEIEIESSHLGSLPTSWSSLPQMTVYPDGRYEFRGGSAPRVARSDGFGSPAVLEWLKAAGVNTTSPDIAAEASEIAGQVRGVARASHEVIARQSPDFYSSNSSRSDSTGEFASRASRDQGEISPPGWAALVILAFWIFVWLAGLRFLNRRAAPTNEGSPVGTARGS